MNYENKSERELIDLAQEGDKIASNILAKNYTPLVHKIAKPYFMKGYNKQDNDLVQEGFIGLAKAIQDYDHNSPIRFSTFAGNLIKNMIINAITKANRQKHKIINQARSIG
ncbi:MAG: RNA polymerase sigma-H factor [Candidatus Frackibacter sp. T328-2]|nr:MAG: RNA polymerase sigma-H factor [Candidatus Frackibacter sp. T328-2]